MYKTGKHYIILATLNMKLKNVFKKKLKWNLPYNFLFKTNTDIGRNN